jgi:DNA-binding Xre family transcriptional regulator
MARIILGKVLKKKGISKRKFAKMLGIETKNVFRLFKKSANPKFSTLQTWAKLIGCKVRDLIEG